MKKKLSKIMSLALAGVMLMTSAMTARADAVIDQPYVCLGADLSDSDRAKVLSELEITEGEIENYDVSYVTNEEEHEYLGSYLSESVIGSRALSSVIITKKDEGNGLNIKTKNISYCTVGMYQNALITAGVEDADIIVAGPFAISGTAGLVGILKAYENLTGEEISDDYVDAALDELVTTGEVADSVGDTDKVEELIALVKQEVIENDLETEEEITEVIEEAADEMDITLSDEDIQKILSLLDKIKDLDIDADALKSQAGDIYNKIKNIDIGTDAAGISKFFSDIFSSISDFFRGLFS